MFCPLRSSAQGRLRVREKHREMNGGGTMKTASVVLRTGLAERWRHVGLTVMVLLGMCVMILVAGIDTGHAQVIPLIKARGKGHVVYTLKNTPVVVNPLRTDIGEGLEITEVKAPRYGGKAELIQATPEQPWQSIKYTPTKNHVGFDYVDYTITDLYGNKSAGWLTTFVLAKQWPNWPPVAPDVKAFGLENGVRQIDVLRSVTDREGGKVIVTGLSSPSLGDAEVTKNGLIRYSPRANTTGTDTFTYTVTDNGGASGTGKIIVKLFPDHADTLLRYKTFKLGLGTVQLPITAFNDLIDISRFFKNANRNTANGAKNSALGLAQAYLTFLKLTEIEKAPVINPGDEAALWRVIRTFGPNYFLSTVVQESQFGLPEKSGYFQLDFEPRQIAGDSLYCGWGKDFSRYFDFLNGVSRDKTINGLVRPIPATNPNYVPDTKVFATGAIIKAYYDAITYCSLTSNYLYKVPDLMGFALNYQKNRANNERLDITVKIPEGTITWPYNYRSDTGLMDFFALFFNRGRSYAKGIDAIKDDETGMNAFTKYFTYADGGGTGDDWGARYIHQVPAVYEELEANAGTHPYDTLITFADVEGYLKTLSDLYGAGVIQAGIGQAKTLMGARSYRYTSEAFFAVFQAVVNTMVEKAADNLVDLHVAHISSPDMTDPGATVEIFHTVRNQGTADAGAFEIALFLSKDRNVDPQNDYHLGTMKVGSLAAGASASTKTSVTIPLDVTAGKYYVGAVADVQNSVVESNEQNNALAAENLLSVATGCDLAYMQQILPRATYNALFLLTVADDPTIANDPDIPTQAATACFADRYTAYGYDRFLLTWTDIITRTGELVACSGDTTKDRIELAAMFANFVQESGLNMGDWYYNNRPNPVPRYKLGLCKGVEDNCPVYATYPVDETVSPECPQCVPGRPDGKCPQACRDLDPSMRTVQQCNWEYACFYYPQPNAHYCGRGPIQLTYNDAYGKLSEWLYNGDRTVLLDHPELVGTNFSLTLLSAFRWWTVPMYSDKPSAHAVISGDWTPMADDIAKGRGNNFATVILAVNGALECGKGASTIHANQRAENFTNILNVLGLGGQTGPWAVSDCSNSVPF